ncbi:MAG TPA: alpha/beta fold hydrolase [Thermoanaerobaculia bacterium]
MQHLFLALALLLPVEHDFVVRDFHFKSGETLAEVRIHYVTLGDPAGKPVLILHGTGGSSKQFLNDHFADVLFKEGGALDARTHFIVIPDNVGHGQSSKPSDGLRGRFPHYDYDDMVELQHRLLVDGLHLHRVHLVMGTSMGGMQTWMWGEHWPTFMDALLPLASAPAQIAGRNRVWRKMAIDDLKRGDVAGAVQLLMIATSSPLQWQKSGPTRDDADRWLAEQMKSRLANTDADDLLYALEASRNYDPAPELENIAAPLIAINSADDFVNPPELGILERAIQRVKRGRYVLIPTSEATRGHGTHTWAALWQQYVRELDTPPR